MIKKLSRPFFLFFSILMVLNSCSNQPSEQIAFNSDSTFSVLLPDGWRTSRGKKETDLVVISPKEDSTDVLSENVNIFSEKLEHGKTLEEYFSDTKEKLPKLLPNVEFIDEGDSKIGNLDSKWFQFTFKRAFPVMCLSYIVTRDSVSYVIMGTAEKDKFEKYRNKFVEIASSIKFK